MRMMTLHHNVSQSASCSVSSSIWTSLVKMALCNYLNDSIWVLTNIGNRILYTLFNEGEYSKVLSRTTFRWCMVLATRSPFVATPLGLSFRIVHLWYTNNTAATKYLIHILSIELPIPCIFCKCVIIFSFWCNSISILPGVFKLLYLRVCKQVK